MDLNLRGLSVLDLESLDSSEERPLGILVTLWEEGVIGTDAVWLPPTELGVVPGAPVPAVPLA